ncbi:uncharacterized protein LOC143283112 isoform X2 [Babylonia areolata]|uniref:uncharacterized protein LOC143283112 isoform X2 n=1 Tax=Babylonia areolata TaxID=304850 RepID=UPI003FD0F380
MKGQAPSMSSSSDVTEPEVRVKRKCGRPRNPIPRHRRVSHISAEQRRRGKIQKAMADIKAMIPKEKSTGKNSKADLLTDTVKFVREAERVVQEQERLLQQRRAEKQALKDDIERCQQNLPEGKLFEKPLTFEQRLDNMVSEETKKNPKYFVFKYMVEPMYRRYLEEVDCSDMQTFRDTIQDWANKHLNQKSLRCVATDALRTFGTETSFIDSPDQLIEEAQQQSQSEARGIPVTVISTGSRSTPQHSQPCQRQTASRKHSNKTHHTNKRQKKNTSSKLPSCKETLFDPYQSQPVSHSAQFLAGELSSEGGKAASTEDLGQTSTAGPVTSQPLVNSTLMFSNPPLAVPKAETDKWTSYAFSDFPSLRTHSPVSSDSAIELSPVPSAHESFLYGDLIAGETSLDQYHDNDAITTAKVSTSEDFMQLSQSTSMALHGSHHLFDLGTWDTTIDFAEPNGQSSSNSLESVSPLHPAQQPEQCMESISAETCSLPDQEMLDFDINAGLALFDPSLFDI